MRVSIFTKIKSTLKENRVIRAGLGYSIGNYLLKGINFILLPIFARIMTTQDYGMYSLYLSYESMLGILLSLALYTSLKSANLEYKDTFNDYVASIMTLLVIIMAGMLILVNIFSQPLSNFFGFSIFILNLMVFNGFSAAVINTYNGNLSIDYKYTSFLKISFINTIANISVSLILMFTVFKEQKFLARIMGMTVPCTIIAVYIIWKCLKGARQHYKLIYWKFALSYSIPIIPHILSQTLLSQSDRVMIANMIGTIEAGIYSFSYNINSIVQVLTTSVDTVWGPWFFEEMSKKEYKKIRKVSTYYIYLMFLIIICVVYISPEVVYIIGGRNYIDGRYVTIPLLMSTFFTFLYTVPVQVEYYKKRTALIAGATAGAAGFNIILNIVCIPKFGYVAAAYTTLVSYIAYFALHYFIARRLFDENLFNDKAILGMSILFLIFGFCAITLVDRWQIRYLVLLFIIIVNLMVVFKNKKEIKNLLLNKKNKERIRNDSN